MHNSKSSQSHKRALVTGGTGAVGPALVHLLLEKGYEVRVLARRWPKDGRLPTDIDFVQGDITEAAIVETAVSNIDIIFHLAAKLHLNDPNPALYSEYQRVNVEATNQLVAAAQRASVQRFIFFSTINVYGESQPPQTFDETEPLNPIGLYAQTKYEAEQAALSFYSPDGDPLSVILRLSSVYGPYMQGNYPRLVRLMRKGWFIPIGRGQNRRTLVFDQDVAQAALLAAEKPEALGQIYNITDGTTPTFQEILGAMYTALERPLPRVTLPDRPLRLGLALFEKLCTRLGKPSPIGTSTIDKLQEDMAVCGRKIQQQLNFRPQYNLQQGWQATIASWK
ncbi:MAG: NAD-dependent epimerase/dehydratase family protein [Chloroflexota bacterium]